MKSGKKLYLQLCAGIKQPDYLALRLATLRTGDLRSLLLYLTALTRAAFEDKSPPDYACEVILSHAMCELTHRFLKKGGKIL